MSEVTTIAGSCCPPAAKPRQTACEASCGSTRPRTDWMLWGSAGLVSFGYLWHVLFGAHAHALDHFAAGAFELFNMMWWGMALGILFVGLMDRIPRDLIIAALSGERRLTGILRATAAGLAFDLCSHGILMVGMKLYERGATIGQTVAFLLASPWNSLTLTVILIALVGWWYTLLFILFSAVIGIVTGLIFDNLVERGHLPDNPARAADGPRPTFGDAWTRFRADTRFTRADIVPMFAAGLRGSRMVLRWLLFGIVLASAIRAFVPADVFADWFGPTMLGMLLTVIAATIIEVCSEGSTPIAADLVARANAPGNGFVFLMAGVATDYTEVMSLKDTTRSWRIALALPLIAVPQTLAIGLMINLL
ncbi:MAG: permease [Pseudomonadota bacterium]